MSTVAGESPQAKQSADNEVTGRLSKQWSARLPLPDSHLVDTRIYTDPAIFEQEIERIWHKTWLPVCHESELANPLDFRSSGIAGDVPIVIVRGTDGKVRTFLNVCPHRGNLIVRKARGNLSVAEPSGNSNHMTCMFHGWQFNAEGRCVEIPRERAGYQDRVCKAGMGLRQIRTEVAYGGFVWVNLDDDGESLDDYMGGIFDYMKVELESEPLEVFHYQKVVINTNYKYFHETGREFYHDFLHYHNRQTGMMQKGYFDRKYVPYKNGHCLIGLTISQYKAYQGYEDRGLTFPGMPKNGWKGIGLFPGITFNLRSSCLRVNFMTPISENRVLIEVRGLGLKRDDDETRASRIRDFNTIWGPFGRNAHEDFLAIQTQAVAVRPGSGAKYCVMAREEDDTTHDEIGLRCYYSEWSRRMGRLASDPTRTHP